MKRRGLQLSTLWIVAILLIAFFQSTVALGAATSGYQFRPLPGDGRGSAGSGLAGRDKSGPVYRGTRQPPQPYYRFRTEERKGRPRYSMPPHRPQPPPVQRFRSDSVPQPIQGTGSTDAPVPRWALPEAQSYPGFRFRPGIERQPNRQNR